MIDIDELRDRAATFGSDYLTDEEWVAVIDRLEAAEKEREDLHALIAAVKKKADAEFRLRVKKEEECWRLQAKVEQMERQAPAYWGPKHAIEGGSTTVIVGKFPVNPTDAPLYSIPGAQPAPSVPDATVLLRRAAMAMEVVGTEWRESDPTLRLDLASALAAAPEAKP